MAETADDLHRLLATGDPEAIRARLVQPGFVPNALSARAVRDRAAQLLLSDPSQAASLAAVLLQALRRAPGGGDAETRAVVYRCYAEACVYTGGMARARQAYEVACAEAERAGDRALHGQILVGRIGTLSAMGEAQEAAQLVARAERLLRSAGDLAYLAKLYMNLGSSHYHQERYPEAYQAYRLAMRALRRAGGEDATWIGLRINQGIASSQLFRLAEARRIFRECETSAAHLGLVRLQAQAQLNRAWLEAYYGDYRTALRLLEDAGRVFAAQGARDMQAASAVSRAEIFLELGMPSEAEELARTAAEGFGRVGMDLDRTGARVVLARALLVERRPDAARPILTAAHDYYHRERIHPQQSVAELLLAEAALALQDPHTALRIARRALRSAGCRERKMLEARIRGVAADASLALGRPAAAERMIRPTLAGIGRLPGRLRWEVWLRGARIARARDRREESLRRLRSAATCIEDQRRLIPGIELRAQAFERYVEVYREWIDLLLESRRPRFGSLMRLMEAARARGFRERMAAVGKRTITTLRGERATLESLIRRLSEIERIGEPDPRRAHQLRQRISALERTILARVRGVEAGPRGRQDSPPPGRARELLPHLMFGESLLSYFVSGHHLVALLLNHDRAAVRVLPAPLQAVEESLQSLHLQLEMMATAGAEPPGSLEFLRGAAEADLGALYRMLWEPLRGLLPERGRITLVPHGPLHQVPFECLHTGRGYVDEHWLIGRLPMAAFLDRRRRRRRRRAGKVLVAGTLHGGPAEIAEELREVAACFPRQAVRRLTDRPAAVLLAEMDTARIVHLSAHGTFREDNPLFSRLHLKEGALFLADLLGRRLSADLAVLSACSSGRVFTGRGDDLSGLAHGFLAAGVRTLIASQWRIHDRATRAWMRTFYRAYTGESEGDAVRALTLANRRTRRAWPHPFYWGGFCAHGA